MKTFLLILMELLKLVISTCIVLALFCAVVVGIRFMLDGLEFLPPYIGDFGTFLVYASAFTIIFVAIYEVNKRQK